MTADQYLHGILLREAVDAGPNSPLLAVQATLMPTLRQWAGNNLLGVYPSGSFMKGTAVLSGTDIDLFLSLSEHTSETLKEIYNKLARSNSCGLGANEPHPMSASIRQNCLQSLSDQT